MYTIIKRHTKNMGLLSMCLSSISIGRMGDKCKLLIVLFTLFIGDAVSGQKINQLQQEHTLALSTVLWVSGVESSYREGQSSDEMNASLVEGKGSVTIEEDTDAGYPKGKEGEVLVENFPCPQVELGDQEACMGEPLQFNPIASYGIPVTVGQFIASTTANWDFGDGTIATGILANPEHTYTNAGTYTYTVTFNTVRCLSIYITGSVEVANCWKPCPEPELIIIGECTSGATVFTLSPSTELAGATITWDFGDGATGTGINVAHTFTSAATYTTTVTVLGPGNCNYTAQKEVTINCCECRTSFAPQPGKKYVLSAWVKETQPNLSGTNVQQQVQTYFAPEIELIFPSKTLGGFKAKGTIIEGWQKIEEVFTVPVGATELKIKLNNTSGKYPIYFDDIRIHPFNSSMKSYVYDPVSLRLWSELDDRNYATFYEYDEQGNLTRIKKETERGIVTIQESREGQYKEEKKF
jgi:PKD repeat protein